MAAKRNSTIRSCDELNVAVADLKRRFGGSLLLFRGQEKLYDRIQSGRSRPCYKSTSLIEAGWSTLASKLLGLPKEAIYSGTVQAILQHYGFATNYVDLTSDANIASWFASNHYSSSSSSYLGSAIRSFDVCTYTPMHQGVAYVLILAIPNHKELKKQDRLVDYSELPRSFLRPHRQKAWLLMDRLPTKPCADDFWVATFKLDLASFVSVRPTTTFPKIPA